MRLLFVIQRYGEEVIGGAEHLCRQFATRLAHRGHRCEVLTSRAVDSSTWEDIYPAGSGLDGEVTVHRLDGIGRRDEAYFDALSWGVLYGGQPVAPAVQEAWIRAQGPVLPALPGWLRDRASAYDLVIFFTYLFYPTWAGLTSTIGLAPTVLHATAHDEPPFWLPAYDLALAAPEAFAWSTPEERDLLSRRGLARKPGELIGVGVDPPGPAAATGFARRAGLGDRPYLLFVGRVTEGKGAADLVAWFAAYKQRRPSPLALVVAGPGDIDIDHHPDVVITGTLSPADKDGALAGALALVQPSYFESFSMALTEAWAAGRPALVQSRSDVLAGQARRSQAALPFDGFAQFEVAVDLLLDDPSLGERLGERGRAWVAENYSWRSVLDRYEHLLETARSAFSRKAAGYSLTNSRSRRKGRPRDGGL